MALNLQDIKRLAPFTEERQITKREKASANECFWSSIDTRNPYSIHELQQKLEEAGIVSTGLVGRLQTMLYVASAFIAGKETTDYGRRIFINPKHYGLKYVVFKY